MKQQIVIPVLYADSIHIVCCILFKSKGREKLLSRCKVQFRAVRTTGSNSKVIDVILYIVDEQLQYFIQFYPAFQIL